MKKILILFSFPLFLFSVDCCSELGDDYVSAGTTLIRSESNISPFKYVSENCVGWDAPSYPLEVGSTCSAGLLTTVSLGNSASTNVEGGDLNGYYGDGDGHYCTASFNKTNIEVVDYNCECTQESTPLSELSEPPLGYIWRSVGDAPCQGAETVDIELFESTPLDMRTIQTQSVGCCGSSTYYYIAESSSDANCTVNQDEIDGVCYDKCDVNQTRVNLECVDGNPIDCKVRLGSDWITNTNVLTPDACGALVDGENYSNASFIEDDSHTSTCCLKPILPNFNCPSLGENWTGHSVDSGDSCGALVDGVTYDSAQYKEFDTISPTCCVHAIDNPDANGTNPEDNNNPDSNGTSSDRNDSADTSAILDSIEASSDLAHSDSQSVVDAITSSSDIAHTDATDIKDSVDSASRTAHGDATDIKDSIGNASRLAHTDSRDIKDTIGDASDLAHDDATDIKDAIESLNEGNEEAKDSLSGIKEGMADALINATDKYNSTLDIANTLLTSYSNTSPVFVGSGEHVFSVTIYNSDIVFDLSIFVELKPFFDIIFLLMLAWINFKIYLWIFNFLVMIGV